MEREIENALKIWSQKDKRKPLVLRGARQIGKTYSIDKFGKENYENYIKIDFEQESSLSVIFDGDLKPKKLFNRILLEKKIGATPKNTLIFLDEIQLCPRALMALRYFYEDMPESNVIAAGSLLEFSLQNSSFPVGRVEYLWMFPMNFYEFLRATNNKNLIEFIPLLSSEEKVDDFVHNKLLELLKIYFLVGGMPEAVSTYCANNSFLDVQEVHANLCNSFIDDFAKYNKKVDRFLLETIFGRIPSLTGKHIKYSHLADDFRNDKIKEAYNVLKKSLVAYSVFATSGELPLNFSCSDKIFKTVFLDIGLMQYLCDIQPSEILDSDNLATAYNGALAEQFVGQQIISTSNKYPKIYFWNRLKKSSLAELDYIISQNGKIVPIEVKSGSSGSLKSLHLFLDIFQNTKNGYVFSNRNISEIKEQRLKFVPLYCRIEI